MFVVIEVPYRNISDRNSEEPNHGIRLEQYEPSHVEETTYRRTNPRKIVRPLSVHPRPEQTLTLIQLITMSASQKTHSMQLRIMTALMLYHR